MWDILITVGLAVCCLAALVLTAVRLPGTWLIVVAALGYGWWSDWRRVGMFTLVVLIVIALTGEAIEFLASAVTARKAGASRQAAWGGLAGGVLGMIFLSFLIPIPVVGPMVGALVGCFAGALVLELRTRRQLGHGARVGLFSAVGFVIGTVAKVAVALVMSGILITLALWPETGAPPGP